MKMLTNIELIPHITLNPYDYRKGKTRKVPRRERDKYWQECFAQVGIEGLSQIERRVWKAPIRDVYHELILHRLLQEAKHKIIKKEVGIDNVLRCLEGGLTLFVGNKSIYPAMCCSDLSDINAWEDIISYRDHEWTLLWNGHPMIPVRYYGDMLYFSALSDDAPTSRDAGKYAIPVDVLKTAVNQASQEVQDFQERLHTYWTEHQDEIWR